MLLENSANISYVNRSLYIATGCPWDGLCHLPVPERLQLGIKQYWSLSQENGLRPANLFGGHPDLCRNPAGQEGLWLLVVIRALLSCSGFCFPPPWPILFPQHSSIPLLILLPLHAFLFPLKALAVGTSGAWLWFV